MVFTDNEKRRSCHNFNQIENSNFDQRSVSVCLKYDMTRQYVWLAISHRVFFSHLAIAIICSLSEAQFKFIIFLPKERPSLLSHFSVFYLLSVIQIFAQLLSNTTDTNRTTGLFSRFSFKSTISPLFGRFFLCSLFFLFSHGIIR